MNEVLEQIWAHRSIRAYRPDPLAEETLREILEAGLRASSSGNMQTWSVIVTREEERKRRLWELHLRQDMILQAPVVLCFCADFHRMGRWCRRRDAVPGYDNLLSFLVATGDLFLAAQNSVLAAESLGLGACYMGTTLNAMEELCLFYELPPGVVPVTSVVLGHPAEDPAPRMRLPLDGLLHQERYRDYDDAEIDGIYQLRDTEGWLRYLAIPELAERMGRDGITNLAQVYTRLKYRKADFDEATRRILALLRRQGFMAQDD
jgi:nitroreductase